MQDTELALCLATGTGVICSALCALSLLDDDRKPLQKSHNQSHPTHIDTKKYYRQRRRESRIPSIGLKDLLYCNRLFHSRTIISRRHTPLSDKERLDQLCLLSQLRSSESEMIQNLRFSAAFEREQRLFCEKTAQAERDLRRECEEQIAIYSSEVNKLKEGLAIHRSLLTDKDATIEELQTRLAALESILRLLTPNAEYSQGQYQLNQATLASVTEERDLLRQENEELRVKLIEDRKKAREEKERLERQIAQYNLFLMMGAANNATTSANSPNASPARISSMKVDSNSFESIPIMQTITEAQS